MALTAAQIGKLNKMNRAAQEPLNSTTWYKIKGNGKRLEVNH